MTEPETDHPFKPGLRVALTIGYSETPREGFVDKVHKSGRFTLVGSVQQWRPSCYGFAQGRVEWGAHRTGGNSWDRSSVRVWDAESDKAIAQHALFERMNKVRDRIEHIKKADLTEAMVSALEALVTK